MTARRRKAAHIEAPATIVEATRLIAEYLELEAQIGRTMSGADDAIRQIEAIRDEQVKPVEAMMYDKFIQLRTWWAVARPDLTDGKRKSIELAGALIGDRTSPPALKLPKGMKVDQAVEFIAEIMATFPDAEQLLRTKVELEKPALLKLLGNATDPAPLRERIVEGGFRAEQKEEFFIARAADKPKDPVIEDEPVEVVS